MLRLDISNILEKKKLELMMAINYSDISASDCVKLPILTSVCISMTCVHSY